MKPRGKAVWIVGEPGVGKTTLMRELLLDLGPPLRVARPKHEVYDDGSVFVAGHYKGDKFDGSDTLPISDLKPLRQLWLNYYTSCEFSFFEGDKLSNGKVLEAVRSTGICCCVIHLVGDAEQVAARRFQRGTTQNATWVAGRKKKSANFAAMFDVSLRLETDRPTLDVVRQFLGGFR